ncbi:cytoskeletal protein RodZ [Kitasatospora gansuensis]|uniref:Cytoskeletal protein RodZ n=1 Tax=Kitasatospora gansuensis TaxID=258050 RepID=A0A7W7WGG2_9ACTN|nr:hypothetical protein [Kitasatospora gansuensis]MBB4946003.1 cytoskeletal protein RodZ [Kitasatospora gansuensis]
MYESNLEEAAPAPVFVSESGRRGRLLRGFGWPVSVVGALLAVVMASSLVGMQADAPAMGIPVQPSAQPPTPVTPPSPTPAPTPSPTASPSPSSHGTPSRSATPSTKTTPKPTTTTPRGAKSSGQPTKQP